MGIKNYYNKTVVTKRLANVGGASKRQRMTQVNAALTCAIHPLSSEDAVVGGSAFYQTFKMLCAVGTDIEVGDQVIDGTDKYKVEGKQVFDDVSSSNTHIALTIFKGQ